MTYCDYTAKTLVPKPRAEMYEKAEREANAPSADHCYFVGSSPFMLHLSWTRRADAEQMIRI
jgi:FMN phosphatase YigB (HAD superfamily)